MNREVALEKMKAYCAYQERCQLEVQTKLKKLAVYGDLADDIIITLIQENFLSEERYAEAYVSGKFNIKKWGRNKIKLGLKQKQISDYCIKKGLQTIDETEYLNTLDQWIEKLQAKYASLPPFNQKGKIAQYLTSKGFETGLIWERLRDE